MDVITSLMNETMTNSSNGGRPPPPPHYVHELKRANQIIISIVLALIMLAMGCVISIKEIKTTLQHPVGVLVGIVSQFIIMPLATFALAHAVSIETPFAIGMLIIGCSPGGTISNMFTYWTDGDVCLSVVMTTASTILAFGMMPLNLFIYSRSWTDENSVIPYSKIAVTLAVILGPVMIGIFIRYKFKFLATYITKIGSIAGLVGIMAGLILTSFINPGMFTSGWKVWFTAIILPWLGLTLGYVIALLLRQSHVKCRTIAFETGNQNVGLSLGVILLTFHDSPVFLDLLTFPSLFGIFMFIDSFVCVLVCRLITKFNRKHEEEEDKMELAEK